MMLAVLAVVAGSTADHLNLYAVNVAYDSQPGPLWPSQCSLKTKGD